MVRTALVVGINTYSHFRNLKAPAQDAEAIAQRLQQDGEFQVIRLPEVIDGEQGNRAPMVGMTREVTQAALEKHLRLLFHPDSPQQPEAVLFYFSGHGLRDPDGGDGLDKGYLATSDTNPDQPRAGISLAWLRNLVSRSPIQNQIIWLDCCHSGGFLIDIDAANPGQSQQQNRCFIASSRDYEKSWQDLNSPYSVLTKALLDGLDPQHSPETWVNTRTLVNYINNTLRGEIQSPVCTYFGDAINLTCSETLRLATATTITDTGICPYKGLEFFDLNSEDPKYFFGRETLTDQLLDHVRTRNFMALVGASGNGKSSVLRAGLLHQLCMGRLVESDQWQILIVRPDAQPMQSLATAFLPEDGSQLERANVLKHLSDGATGLARLVEAATAPRVVLVVDQFEEVFTRCDDVAEQEQFFACLMGALEATGDKLCLIIAMRSDFVGKCLEREYSGLAQRVQDGMVSVLPMAPAELREAVCKPAAEVGLTVEAALVTEILEDVQGAPGSLPLLQYTLKELWQRRQNNQLVLSAYQALGGINGTLDQRATALYNSFDAGQQRTVQHIFQQLTQLGEGTEDTRRRVFLDNLIAAPLHPTARVQAIVDTLSNPDNRLLVTSEVVSKGDATARRAIVDVAHEALIRHWRLLRQWIEQNRDLLRQQRRIEASAVNWQENQNAKGYLLQGLPLDEAIQFQQQAEAFPLSNAAQTYIRNSRRQRQWNRFKTASWLIIPAAIVIGVVEHNIREESVKADYARLDSDSQYEEKQAVEDLVKGCKGQQSATWMPTYLAERLFGNCRNLARAPLANADLSGADLRGVDLRGARLSSADLRGTDLRGAILSSADLSEVNLSEVNLSEVNLSSADLRGADLSNAVLSGTDLSFTDLSTAVLSNAVLSNADLSGADLSGADLSGARLSGADLSGAILRNADLSFAVLSTADLSFADLSTTNLSNAVLSTTNLSGVDLSNAVLGNTVLGNADLSGAILRNADLSNTVLRDAVLRDAILLASDLRNAQNLTLQQVTGENHPYLCNVALPDAIDLDRNRDCARLPGILVERYRLDNWSAERAERIVKDAMVKKWD
jgi:uncharacterized protein YjbI with pentapeptide repeats